MTLIYGDATLLSKLVSDRNACICNPHAYAAWPCPLSPSASPSCAFAATNGYIMLYHTFSNTSFVCASVYPPHSG